MDAVHGNAMLERQNLEIEGAIRRERHRLLNFIRKRVQDEADAHDILQDVFWQLTETYRALGPVERVTAWLFRVARNKIVDRYRKRAREASSMTVTGEDAESLNLEDILPDLSHGPETLYLREVIWSEIEASLEDLPRAQRDVFVWHEFEGLSFREISALTGDSENALRLRKLYAVRALRARLERLYDAI